MQASMCFGPGHVLKTINVRYSGITLSLSSLCSLAKATFSITTETIVNELSVVGKLVYCFIYPYCFLSKL